jgi:hypothetical protein
MHYKYAGIELKESSALTKPGPDEFKKRTLYEKLFSLPWKPFKKFDTIKTFLPDDNLYYFKNQNMIVGHPEKIRAIKEVLKDELLIHNKLS